MDELESSSIIFYISRLVALRSHHMPVLKATNRKTHPHASCITQQLAAMAIKNRQAIAESCFKRQFRKRQLKLWMELSA